MRNVTFFVRNVLCLSVVLTLAATARAQTPEPGPENGGLRLKFVIVQNERRGSHTMNLELLNTGAKPVVLIGMWDYENDKGDYAAWFKDSVAFVTYPEVQPELFQTAGMERKSPQPTCELKPGKSMSVSWPADGDKLREDVCVPGTTPIFPSAGLYGIRASIPVLTKDGMVLLVSNEQSMEVGGVRTLPKFATGHVRSVNKDKNTVCIDLGSIQKIEKGDVFRIRVSLEASWQLTITNVGMGFAEGPVVRTPREPLPGRPAMPQEGWLATLEAKPKK